MRCDVESMRVFFVDTIVKLRPKKDERLSCVVVKNVADVVIRV